MDQIDEYRAEIARLTFDLAAQKARADAADQLALDRREEIARLREALHTIDCPCCGGVAAIARFFEDGQETICGCGGVVECDGETAHVWVEECEIPKCADHDAALAHAPRGEKEADRG